MVKPRICPQKTDTYMVDICVEGHTGYKNEDFPDTEKL